MGWVFKEPELGYCTRGPFSSRIRNLVKEKKKKKKRWNTGSISRDGTPKGVTPQGPLRRKEGEKNAEISAKKDHLETRRRIHPSFMPIGKTGKKEYGFDHPRRKRGVPFFPQKKKKRETLSKT